MAYRYDLQIYIEIKEEINVEGFNHLREIIKKCSYGDCLYETENSIKNNHGIFFLHMKANMVSDLCESCLKDFSEKYNRKIYIFVIGEDDDDIYTCLYYNGEIIRKNKITYFNIFEIKEQHG